VLVNVRWHPIDRDTYVAVYEQFGNELAVFATHTCMDGCEFHAEPNIMTEWGFPDAPCALIKSHMRGERGTSAERWSYFIAEPLLDDAED